MYVMSSVVMSTVPVPKGVVFSFSCSASSFPLPPKMFQRLILPGRPDTPTDDDVRVQTARRHANEWLRLLGTRFSTMKNWTQRTSTHHQFVPRPRGEGKTPAPSWVVCVPHERRLKNSPPPSPQPRSLFSSFFFRAFFFFSVRGSREERVCTSAPSHDMAMQDERPDFVQPEQTSSTPEATFETRFEQFYLQLSEGKTGGMVVSAVSTLMVTACLFV